MATPIPSTGGSSGEAGSSKSSVKLLDGPDSSSIAGPAPKPTTTTMDDALVIQKFLTTK